MLEIILKAFTIIGALMGMISFFMLLDLLPIMLK